jgi:hypothetical protein
MAWPTPAVTAAVTAAVATCFQLKPLTSPVMLPTAWLAIKAEPIAKSFRAWLEAQRVRVPDGSATAKAIDYSLGRWVALTRYLVAPAKFNSEPSP